MNVLSFPLFGVVWSTRHGLYYDSIELHHHPACLAWLHSHTIFATDAQVYFCHVLTIAKVGLFLQEKELRCCLHRRWTVARCVLANFSVTPLLETTQLGLNYLRFPCQAYFAILLDSIYQLAMLLCL